jgi:hypothetical protein
MQKVWRILAGTAGGFVAAVLAFFPLFYAFLRSYPDCAPNQVDGQCGLASFMDALYAAGVAALLWLVLGIFLSLYLLRRLARSHTPGVRG